jgi:uncharacterized protein (DUF2062 family)
MSAASVTPAPTVPVAPPGFWRRRFVQPVLTQLTQGVTPDRIAATLAAGTVCSILPFFGFTTLLNVGAGLALRMNQPILHALNTLLGPVQLALILVYVRGGELLWGHRGDGFTVGEMLREFRDRSLGEFLQQFGWAGVHAATAWVITSPLVAMAIYFASRPLLRRAARRLSR